MLSINNNLHKPSLEDDFAKWLNSFKTTIVKKSTRLYGPHYNGVPYGVYDDEDWPIAHHLPKSTLDAIYGYDDDFDDLTDYLGQDYYDDDYNPNITKDELKALTEKYGGTYTDSSNKKRGKRGSKKNKIDIGKQFKTKPYVPSTRGKKKKNKPKSGIDDMKDGFEHLSEDRSIFFYPDLNDQKEYETFSNIWELDCYLQDCGIDLPTRELHKICDSFESHCCINPLKLKNGIYELAVEESYGHLRWEYDPSVSSDTSDLPF